LTCLFYVYIINEMQIEYDPDKDALNRRKHGISLDEAKRFEWDTALIEVDARFNYGEWRMTGLGYLGLRLVHITFVDRGDARRIISLRKANKREERHYAST